MGKLKTLRRVGLSHPNGRHELIWPTADTAGNLSDAQALRKPPFSGNRASTEKVLLALKSNKTQHPTTKVPYVLLSCHPKKSRVTLRKTCANLRQRADKAVRPIPCMEVRFSTCLQAGCLRSPNDCRDVQESGLSPRLVRCRHLTTIFLHLAERQGNSLENLKTTGERWPRTSFPFILPSKIRAISAAERPPCYEKWGIPTRVHACPLPLEL